MSNRKDMRILAIAPSTRGFGFALMESGKLVDWGVKSATGDKNADALVKIKKLIVRYNPTVVVLEDPESKGVRRAPRIRELVRRIVILLTEHNVKVKLLSRKQVRRFFFADENGTKHEMARILVERFPEELSDLLPPKRRVGMNEDRRMDIFDAVTLTLHR